MALQLDMWGYFTPTYNWCWGPPCKVQLGLLQEMEKYHSFHLFPNVKQREVSTCWQQVSWRWFLTPEDTGMPWGRGFPLQIWGWDVSDHQSCSIRRGSGFLGNISNLYMFLQWIQIHHLQGCFIVFVRASLFAGAAFRQISKVSWNTLSQQIHFWYYLYLETFSSVTLPETPRQGHHVLA